MPIELGSFSLGSVAGGVVGIIAGHYLTKSRDKETRVIKHFNDAAHIFREAFIPELTVSLSTYKKELEIFYILSDAFQRQESAVIVFKQHLVKTSDIPRFEAAWVDYCYPEGSPEEAPEPFCDYISEGVEKIEKEKRELAVQKINSILEFAKLK